MLFKVEINIELDGYVWANSEAHARSIATEKSSIYRMMQERNQDEVQIIEVDGNDIDEGFDMAYLLISSNLTLEDALNIERKTN